MSSSETWTLVWWTSLTHAGLDGLPLFQGAQWAVDTTLVCPLTREGEPKPHTATTSGVRLEVARRRKEARYPELAGDGGRARLVVQTAQFLRGLASAESTGRTTVPGRESPRGVDAAVELDPGVCRCPGFCTLPFLTVTFPPEWMVTRRVCMKCWGTPVISSEGVVSLASVCVIFLSAELCPILCRKKKE